MRAQIIGISDVSVGYGSPEVPALMDSVCRTLGRRGLLIEPDEISRPPVTLDWSPAFDLQRIPSNFPDHTPAWHRQFQGGALRMVERHRPDVLIVFGSSVFSSLLGLSHRPKHIIYHAYEFISNLSEHDLAAHRFLLAEVDLVITPEIDRLIIDVEALEAYPRNVAAIYNVADVVHPKPIRRLPADQRNGRFLWFGTLHRTQAYADYFTMPQVRDIEFDLFGRITDPDAQGVAHTLLEAPNLRYFGVAPAEELNARRAENIFSLVWWNPELNPGAYYLASNRFFTSVQAGVPPICGPHPQCVDLIERYGCGLVMDDWSPTSFERSLREALRIYSSPVYAEMVANCEKATAEQFSWEIQYKRIEPKIKAALAARAR